MSGKEWAIITAVFLGGTGFLIWFHMNEASKIKGALALNSGQPVSVPYNSVIPQVYYAPLAANALMNPRNDVSLSSGGYAPPVSGINEHPAKWMM